MAQARIFMTEAEKAWFQRQAEREGLSLSAWFRAAAHRRCEMADQGQRFASEADVWEFFVKHDSSLPPGRGPGWHEYKALVDELPQTEFGPA